MRMTVPRLDLTPVLTLMDEEEQAAAEAEAQQQQQAGQPLALEYHECDVPDTSCPSEQLSHNTAQSGREGECHQQWWRLPSSIIAEKWWRGDRCWYVQ